MKKYKAVFFDLDHTLWDYDLNSRETLDELFIEHKVHEIPGVEFGHFHDTFQRVNLQLWDQYDRGFIDRDVIRHDRFKIILTELGSNDQILAERLAEDYSVLSPTKKNLVPNALEVLLYLSDRYPLYLVTNGFESMQTAKAESGGIRKFFQDVITSERAGHKKPAREIFDYTLSIGKIAPEEVVMVGDNILTDIEGATNAGIDSVFYNPRKVESNDVATFEIADLLELKSIL